MPTEPVVALPFAEDDASAVSLECSVSVPPLVTIALPWIVAREEEVTKDSATAAATLMPPLEVEADGVLSLPVSLPPFALAVLFAWLRSPATWPSTPPDGASPLPFAGAPAALAVALLSTAVGPVAAKVTAPPARMLRCVVASAVCVAKVSASAAPIAALPPCVSPDAVVVALAFVMALNVTAPLGVWIGPGDTCALLAT